MYNSVYLFVYLHKYICICINIYIHIYTYVPLPACMLLRNRFALIKHPTPHPPTSTPSSARSPMQAGTRHSL